MVIIANSVIMRPDSVTTFMSKTGFPKILLLVSFISFSVICKYMSTTVHDNGVVEYIFSLVMRLNMTIFTNCDSLILIPVA